MRDLQIWQEYTREEVHSIFSPETVFTSQSGTWGLHGMIRVPSRLGDWIFFVTFGQSQGDHIFDESITDEGVLSWQSQPAQGFQTDAIKELIQHDDRVNTIHLFLRTRKSRPYAYLGTLGYLTHDESRQQPVHFQWQLLSWPAPIEFLEAVGLKPVAHQSTFPSPQPGVPHELLIAPPPLPKAGKRIGVGNGTFRTNKIADYAASDARNRDLGLKGELLVIAHEVDRLKKSNRADLAERIVHVSKVEGDSAGYDIRSYEADGSHRFIAVKTTRGNAATAFFITPNEIAFSAKNSSGYFLYRVYEYDDELDSAKTFLLPGNIANQLALEPTAFRARLTKGDSELLSA
jgi:hypothetical protein